MFKICAIGNLGRDAELKDVKGTDVLEFSVAAKGSRKDSETQWIRCSLWGARGEKLAQYLEKGTRVYIRGEGTVREWESKGKTGVEVKCNVDELELLGGSKKDEGATTTTKKKRRTEPEDVDDDADEDRIKTPFDD